MQKGSNRARDGLNNVRAVADVVEVLWGVETAQYNDERAKLLDGFWQYFMNDAH
jgi:hypothetical protein